MSSRFRIARRHTGGAEATVLVVGVTVVACRGQSSDGFGRRRGCHAFIVPKARSFGGCIILGLQCREVFVQQCAPFGSGILGALAGGLLHGRDVQNVAVDILFLVVEQAECHEVKARIGQVSVDPEQLALHDALQNVNGVAWLLLVGAFGDRVSVDSSDQKERCEESRLAGRSRNHGSCRRCR